MKQIKDGRKYALSGIGKKNDRKNYNSANTLRHFNPERKPSKHQKRSLINFKTKYAHAMLIDDRMGIANKLTPRFIKNINFHIQQQQKQPTTGSTMGSARFFFTF